MAIRGNYDGKLSVFGIVLRIIYFVLFLIAIYFDHRFERIERWARILPKLFGVFLLGFQLVGVIPRYRCDSTSWRICIYNYNFQSFLKKLIFASARRKMFWFI